MTYIEVAGSWLARKHNELEHAFLISSLQQFRLHCDACNAYQRDSAPPHPQVLYCMRTSVVHTPPHPQVVYYMRASVVYTPPHPQIVCTPPHPQVVYCMRTSVVHTPPHPQVVCTPPHPQVVYCMRTLFHLVNSKTGM
jgi:hypothetical protein